MREGRTVTKKDFKRKLDYLNSHPKPVTRRDFISKGLMGAAGLVLAPTLYRTLVQSALAQTQTQTAAVEPAVMIFDLAGGAGLPGNFLVGKAGGPEDLLKGYNSLGWNPRAAQVLDKRFGLPMAGNNISQVLTGMIQVMSPDAQARLRLGSLLHVARDDTDENPLSAISLFSLSGSIGSEIARPTGLVNSASGGRSRVVKAVPNYNAFYVTKLKDITEAVGLPATFGAYSLQAKAKLTQTISKLANYQVDRLLKQSSSSPEVTSLIKENYKGVEPVVASQKAMDPRGDQDISAVYQLNAQSNETSDAVLRAALVMNTLKKNTGPCVITLGGCDYHDGTSTTGDAKDREIGLEIGRAVESAHRMKVPLFFQVLTDGGVYSNGGRAWNGDAGEKCMTVIGMYDPAGAPNYYSSTSMQIGAYLDGQGVDRSTVIGESPALAAYAVFANYLNLCGRLAEFDTLTGAPLNPTQLKSVLVFEGKG